jgi:hypothetical protein
MFAERAKYTEGPLETCFLLHEGEDYSLNGSSDPFIVLHGDLHTAMVEKGVL